MAYFEASAETDAPVSAVWEALLDWEASSAWMWPPTEVEVVGEQRTGMGVRLYAVSTVFGVFKLRDHMIVTNWIDEREIRVRHVGWMVKGDGIFRVEPTANGGARFTWIEDMPLPLGVLGEIAGRLLRRVVEHYLRRSCGTLVAMATSR